MTGSTREPPGGRIAYSVNETAAITRLSRVLLYDQMRTGHLAYLKSGRRRIITRQHLEPSSPGRRHDPSPAVRQPQVTAMTARACREALAGPEREREAEAG